MPTVLKAMHSSQHIYRIMLYSKLLKISMCVYIILPVVHHLSLFEFVYITFVQFQTCTKRCSLVYGRVCSAAFKYRMIKYSITQYTHREIERERVYHHQNFKSYLDFILVLDTPNRRLTVVRRKALFAHSQYTHTIRVCEARKMLEKSLCVRLAKISQLLAPKLDKKNDAIKDEL